jgi:hypothetical protein
LPRLGSRENPLVQHEQPALWDSPIDCGDTVEQYGAVSMTRGALASQCGQSHGNS